MQYYDSRNNFFTICIILFIIGYSNHLNTAVKLFIWTYNYVKELFIEIIGGDMEHPYRFPCLKDVQLEQTKVLLSLVHLTS